ncbi:MAG: hypothetical protein ACQSGP_09155, partial [Frankia sp.]
MTTTAALTAWAWPGVTRRRSLLVEADPAGGTALRDLYGATVGVDAGTGLLAAALAARHGMTPQQLAGYAVRLDEPGQRLLLAGLGDPLQGQALHAVWPGLADAMHALGVADPATDVLADCGRLGAYGPPAPLLASADVLLLVVRPRAADLAAAQTRIAALRAMAPPPPAGPDLAVVLTGPGRHRPGEVSEHLGLPVVGQIPYDTRLDPAGKDTGLAVLARRGHDRSVLGLAAYALARGIRTRLAARVRQTAAASDQPPSPPSSSALVEAVLRAQRAGTLPSPSGPRPA